MLVASTTIGAIFLSAGSLVQKIVEVDGIGEVVLIKKRRMRSIRLRLDGHGRPTVSLPSWATYAAAIAFVKSKRIWVLENASQSKKKYQDNQAIGKFHRLKIVHADGKLSARVSNNLVTLKLPTDTTQLEIDRKLHTSIEKALRIEAEKLLPHRLSELAIRHGFSYKSVEIKKLTRRWGSCSSNNEIVLNLHLMQLPWSLIDYVILHELTHTVHHDHSKDFWTKLSGVLPNAKQLRLEIKSHNASVF